MISWDFFLQKLVKIEFDRVIRERSWWCKVNPTVSPCIQCHINCLMASKRMKLIGGSILVGRNVRNTFFYLSTVVKYWVPWCVMMKSETFRILSIDLVLCLQHVSCINQVYVWIRNDGTYCFRCHHSEMFANLRQGFFFFLYFAVFSTLNLTPSHSLLFQWLTWLNKYLHVLWWHPAQDEWLFRHHPFHLC